MSVTPARANLPVRVGGLTVENLLSWWLTADARLHMLSKLSPADKVRFNERVGGSQDKAEAHLGATKVKTGGDITVVQMRAISPKHCYNSNLRSMPEALRAFTLALNPTAWYFCHAHETIGAERWNNGEALIASWVTVKLCHSIYKRNCKFALGPSARRASNSSAAVATPRPPRSGCRHDRRTQRRRRSRS